MKRIYACGIEINRVRAVNDMKMISVIIPLFKGKKYVRKLLDNLNCCYQKQKLKNGCQMEVIFVNDDPEERPMDKDIFEGYGFTVHIIENERNCGIHYSRLRGLESAKGNYIHFLDQDDHIDEMYYISQLKYMPEYDVVICNGKYRKDRVIIYDKKTEDRIRDAEEYFSVLGGIVSPGQALIKKECIPCAWKENILTGNYCDDAFLWLMLKNEGRKFTVNKEILYYHSEDGNNASFQWTHTADALEEMYGVIEEKSLLKKIYEKRLQVCIQEKVKKHRQYAKLEQSFQKMLAGKERLKNYLNQNQINTLAVYGYGYYGKKFIKFMKECSIKVSYVLDKDAVAFVQNEWKIRTLEDELDTVDLIVITPILDFEIIKEKLSEKTDIKCMSLDKFCEFSVSQ